MLPLVSDCDLRKELLRSDVGLVDVGEVGDKEEDKEEEEIFLKGWLDLSSPPSRKRRRKEDRRKSMLNVCSRV